jgi:GTP-binding nuclear protein Ran
MVNLTANPVNYKIAIIGKKSVGKTAYFDTCKNTGFNELYFPTTNSIVGTLNFETSVGLIDFNVTEFNEDNISTLLASDFNGAVLMFSTVDRSSFEFVRSLNLPINTLPTVLCGNKADIPRRAISHRDAYAFKKGKFNYYDISARSGYNFYKPLSNKLSGSIISNFHKCLIL